MNSSEKLNLMGDELIEYLEELKARTTAKANRSEKLLEEFGYDVKTDLPPEVHRHFDTLANNNQISGLNDDGLPDELESKMDSLTLNHLVIKLKRQVKIVDATIQNLEKENIHLNREVEKQKKMQSLEEKSIEALVESEQLRARLQKYTIRLQNMEQSHDIVSKCEKVRNLHEKRKLLKEDIAQAERKLEKYCGLPPNIEQAQKAINGKKVEIEAVKKLVALRMKNQK